MNKIKLIYSQKYNQFYKPVRIDEDVGIVYIKVANNRRDKSIQKNEVYQIDEDSKYKFIVIHRNH